MVALYISTVRFHQSIKKKSYTTVSRLSRYVKPIQRTLVEGALQTAELESRKRKMKHKSKWIVYEKWITFQE
jgi:hypothetical protein